MNDSTTAPPPGTTITATEVRGWFGRDAPALSEAACERLAVLMQRLATPRDLLQPTPAYAAYLARGWPEILDPFPDDMLWDAKAVSKAVQLLRGIVPKLRKWDDLLGTPDTRADLTAMERLDDALTETLPHLERAWGRCLPDHRKQPPAWEMPALAIAGAFETALRQADKKPGRGPTTVVWQAIWQALKRLDRELDLKVPAVSTVFEHVDRLRDKAGVLTKDSLGKMLARMDPTVAAQFLDWLEEQGIDPNDLRQRHRLKRTSKPREPRKPLGRTKR